MYISSLYISILTHRLTDYHTWPDCILSDCMKAAAGSVDKVVRSKASTAKVLINSIIANDLEVAVLLKLLDGLHAPPELVELLLQDIRALLLPALLLRVALLLALDDEVLHAQLLQHSSLRLLIGLLAALLRQGREGPSLEGLGLALMQLVVFGLLDGHWRDVFVLLVVAVRDGPLLLADRRQIFLHFGGRARSGLQEVVAVLGDGGLIGFDLPRSEKRELVVLSGFVSAAHGDLILKIIY